VSGDLFGGTLPIDLEAQIREVERELQHRRRLYPRWVQSGRMTERVAERQMAAMEAVLATLRTVVDRGVWSTAERAGAAVTGV
jgi:hypothetical protein